MQMQNLSIPKLLLKMSPPVMLALLIQSISDQTPPQAVEVPKR